MLSISLPPRFRSRIRRGWFLFTLALFGGHLGLSTPAGAAALPLRGDVNHDGKVNIQDAVLLLRASVHLTALSPEQLNAADLNGDGSISVLDALVLLNAVAHGAPLSPLSSPPPTARFSVDLASGTVHQTTDPSARTKAVFGGSRVVFNTSTLLDEPGNTGRKVLNVSLTNISPEPMGIDPNGTVRGIKLIFSGFNILTAYPDIRSKAAVSTLAGTGALGSADGPALSSTFGGPNGVAVDEAASVYVSDYSNNVVRKIESGQVSTLAGSGVASSTNGAGTAASFNGPWGLAYSSTEDALFLAENGGNRIRRITKEGVVTTVAGTGAVGGADGPGASATFNQPNGVAVDTNGAIYVSEAGGHRIRKLVKSGNDYTVITVAGSGVAGVADGVGTAAQFNTPRALAVDGSGVVYVADSGNNKVRRIAPGGEVTTIAGTGANGTVDGTGNAAQFSSPFGIAVTNGAVVVADAGSHRLRQLTLKPGGSPAQAASWVVQTFAGPPPGTVASGTTDGSGDVARFNGPRGIASDAGGAVYVAEFTNRKVRKVSPANGYFPIGVPAPTSITEPVQLSNAEGRAGFNNGATDLALPYLTYAQALDPGATSSMRKWAFSVPQGVSGFEFTVTVEAATDTLAAPPSAVNAGSPDVWVRTLAGSGNPGFADGALNLARFSIAYGLAMDASGTIYVADATNHAIRRIGTDGKVTTIAGGNGPGTPIDGPGSGARFNLPFAIAATADGNTLFVADNANNRIRRLTLTGAKPALADSWTVHTIAGSGTAGALDGDGATAQFNSPYGIACDPDGANVFVAEVIGNRIRRVRLRSGNPALAASWAVTFVAGDNSASAGAPGTTDGTGFNARFNTPRGLALDPAGSLYVADDGNYRIRKITEPTSDGVSTVSTLAGTTSGYQDGPGASAMFTGPRNLAVDSAGYVYVADTFALRIRRISPSGWVSTVAGDGTLDSVDGPGNTARFYYPIGIAVDPYGNLYVTDALNASRIRLIQRVLK